MFAKMVGGLTAILVGVSLVPTIANQVNTAALSTNDATGWGTMALKIVPGLFALAVLGVGIVTWMGLRNAGVVGSSKGSKAHDFDMPVYHEQEVIKKAEPRKEYNSNYTEEIGRYD